jgi:nucleotide-binding universal stress UspA family protein
LAVLERNLVEQELAAAGRRFHEACRGGERHEWRSSLELPLPALARRALMADLVVMGDMPADRNDFIKFISTGDAVMKAGRPVLRVPACGMDHEPRTVAIAWKDTAQARRAVADALPFLWRADTVLIFTIPEHGGREAANASMANLIGYLSAHDIKSTGVCLPATGAPGAELLQAAGRSGADLLVAGAFGRSRLEEWVFSGVTHTLLKDAQIPILFSH